MAVSAQRHHKGGDYDKRFCKFFDAFFRVINRREKSAHQNHDCRHAGTAENTEEDHLVICIFGFLYPASAKLLTNHDGNTAAQLNVDDIEQVADGGGNILCGNHFQSADGIALRNDSHTGCPEHFIEHQRTSLNKYPLQNCPWNFWTVVSANDIAVFFFMRMSPEYHDETFHETRDHSCYGCALDAQCGGAEDAEN